MKNGPIGRDASLEEIKAASNALLGHTFGDIGLSVPDEDRVKVKGKPGEWLEHYYGMEADIRGEPDFRSANIELKCKPLKISRDEFFRPKEPLSVGMIDYAEVAETEYWHDVEKLRKKFLNLMIVWYVYKDGEDISDFPFIWWQISSPPPELEEEIQREYETVRQQILDGRHLSQTEAGNDILQTCPKHNFDFSSREKGSYVVGDVHPHLDKPERRSWRIPSRFLVKMLANSAGVELVESYGYQYVRRKDLWERCQDVISDAVPIERFLSD